MTLLFTGTLLFILPALSRSVLSPLFRAGTEEVRAASQSSWQVPGEHLALPASANVSLTIDYPQDGSIFPPEITAPTFLWRDTGESAKTWRIDISFADGAPPLRARSQGAPMQIGEIDPPCISSTNQLPSLTPEQAASHTWKPDADMWTQIKRRSSGRQATVTITGIDVADRPVSHSHVSLSTSKDPVDGQIFYRDVPLMPSEGKKASWSHCRLRLCISSTGGFAT